MKKLLLGLMVLFAVSLVNVDKSSAAFFFSYTHSATYVHYANNSPWWTGLGILNTSGTDLTVYVVAINPGNTSQAYGLIELGAGEKTSATLTNLIDFGSVPSTGYLKIYGDGAFLVTKFTGNTDDTGFSEVQLTPTQSPGTVLIGELFIPIPTIPSF